MTLTKTSRLLFILLFPLIVQAEVTEDCLDFHVIQSEPLGYIDNDGITKGVHWDYLAAIEKASGICINKTLFPYARVWQSIKLGTHDGGIAFRSEDRSALVNYVGSIRAIKTVVIPLQNQQLKSYEELSSLIVGKMRGSHLSNVFDNDKNLSLIQLKSYTEVIEMIKKERIDAIAGNVMVLFHQLKKHNTLNAVDLTSTLTLGQKVQWLQLSKKSKHLDKKEQLERAIVQLKMDGTFDAIMDKYYGENWRIINN